jgi:hypothetical protein
MSSSSFSSNFQAGLPDGFLFQTKNPDLGKFWEGPRSENVEIFYAHLEYFTDIRDILGPFGTFCVHLVHFFRFWYILSQHRTFKAPGTCLAMFNHRINS